MATDVIERPAEFRTIADFLRSAGRRASGLVIEGEAGIGKTTLWLAGIAEARQSGFTVLSARSGHAESVLAYAALADMLGDVDHAVLADLPEVQRVAIDRVLLRAGGDGPQTDQGDVAAAFSAVIDHLSEAAPVLLAIDDVQWLDPSSQAVVAYAARRTEGRFGLLATERTQDAATTNAWLQLSSPDAMSRIRVGPLSLGGLHALISSRTGKSLPRPTMVRIVDISGGNPFYALELARAADGRPGRGEQVLPTTLAELMRRRIGRLERDIQTLLLAAACAATPTVDLLAQVTGTPLPEAAALLEEAQSKALIAVDDDVVRFAHPLLARSVYTDARPSQRRAMHRALAEVVDVPELKARHMALAASSADPLTLEALDTAADAARARGAPAAAAELVELAIGLGGDTPMRRINAADFYLQCGDLGQAARILDDVAEHAHLSEHRALALNLMGTIEVYRGDNAQAVVNFEEALDNTRGHRELRVRTLLLLAHARLNAGQLLEALQNVERAAANADYVGDRDLTSQVLTLREVIACMCGRGVDNASLRKAVVLQDLSSRAPIAFRAHAVSAWLSAWVGRLDDARREMAIVIERCVQRGAEADQTFAAVFMTMIEVWSGNYLDAEKAAAEALERAQQLGSDQMRVVATNVQSVVAAYQGEPAATRELALAAIDLAKRCGSPNLTDWPTASLGFIAVSLGDHEGAIKVLKPLVDQFPLMPGTEIITALWVPDAIEALIATGRGAEAEPMIDAMETNGALLDRPWMLSIGARGRSLLLAAHGDVAAASEMAETALAQHDRLPMPFERARTLLLLGQLLRRQRKKETARATLGEAMHTFQDLGSPLWAQRAKAELDRVTMVPSQDVGLTPAEQRVAQLAATGMTTKDVAAALFISPKTVETNLSRIYRKLGIKSRAELGRVIGG